MASTIDWNRSTLFNNAGVFMVTVGNYRVATELFRGALASSTSSSSLHAQTPLHRDVVVAESRLDTLRHSNPAECVPSPLFPSATRQFPYLSNTPMMIHQGIQQQDDLLKKATILFNLGLAHQLIQPNSFQIPHLYHSSTAALYDIPDSKETFSLAVALLNNSAVWCHTMGDVENMRSCMERLSVFLAEEEDFSLEPESARGVLSNVCVLLSDEPEASPAA